MDFAIRCHKATKTVRTAMMTPPGAAKEQQYQN
jgi:hypothetical protein